MKNKIKVRQIAPDAISVSYPGRSAISGKIVEFVQTCEPWLAPLVIARVKMKMATATLAANLNISHN